MDITKIPANVLAALRNRNLTDDAIKQLSPSSAFDHFCEWNNISRYTDLLIDALDGLRAAMPTTYRIQPLTDDTCCILEKSGKAVWFSDTQLWWTTEQAKAHVVVLNNAPAALTEKDDWVYKVVIGCNKVHYCADEKQAWDVIGKSNFGATYQVYARDGSTPEDFIPY